MVTIMGESQIYIISEWKEKNVKNLINFTQKTSNKK